MRGVCVWKLWSVYKCVSCVLGDTACHIFPSHCSLFLSFSSALSVRKMVYGVFRSIWQCRWDRGKTASDLAVSLFRFRHSASSSGLAALLAKPQSNHLNLLCALRGHPVTLTKALNMCSTIHVHVQRWRI